MGKSAKGKTPEYRAWCGMKYRCYNQNNKRYKDYGGRGIKVCDRWKYSFENFLADMGPKPSIKHSLDRFPNNDGDYEPANCRWATLSQQGLNKRNNSFIKFRGKKLTISQWANKLGTTCSNLAKMMRIKSFSQCYRYYKQQARDNFFLEQYLGDENSSEGTKCFPCIWGGSFSVLLPTPIIGHLAGP